MNGILFKPDMIQAIIEGRKTQTRRVMKPQPPDDAGLIYACNTYSLEIDGEFQPLPKPRYHIDHIGQTLYIKEAWKTLDIYDGLKPRELPRDAPIYFAFKLGESEWLGLGKWRSPMFLMEWMARYFIQITDVRPERLQDITEEDALKEGIASFKSPLPKMPELIMYYWGEKIPEHIFQSAEETYANLWNSINGEGSYESNPYVWVYSFKLVTPDKKIG